MQIKSSRSILELYKRYSFFSQTKPVVQYTILSREHSQSACSPADKPPIKLVFWYFTCRQTYSNLSKNHFISWK